MFKNNYQGGGAVEIFSGQGKDPVAKWKLSGGPSAIHKEYDKEVKGFVYCLGGSSQTVKMQMPENGKMSLGLLQRFLVLQVNIPQLKDFSIELVITDSQHLKRRLHLSTVHKELSATLLHAKIPLVGLKRNTWSTVCIDLVSFSDELFKGFLMLDGITLFATCKVRRILTIKPEPSGMSAEDLFVSGVGVMESIPRSCQFPPGVSHVTQVLNMQSLQKADEKAGLLSSDCVPAQPATARAPSHGRTRPQGASNTASASRVTGPPSQTGRKSSAASDGMERSFLLISNMGPSSSKMNHKVTAESRSIANQSENLSHGETSSHSLLEGTPGSLLPHPPKDKVFDKVGSKKVRVFSAGKERPASAAPPDAVHSGHKKGGKTRQMCTPPSSSRRPLTPAEKPEDLTAGEAEQDSRKQQQKALGWFAAECDAVGMRVSISKSEAMVLCRKTVDCPLCAGSESLPQVKELRYLEVLFTSEGKTDHEHSSSPNMESSGAAPAPPESPSCSVRPGLSGDLQVCSSWENNEGSEPQLTLQEVFTFLSQPHSPKRGQGQGDQEKGETGDEQVQSSRGRRCEAQPEDDFIGSESDEDNTYTAFQHQRASAESSPSTPRSPSPTLDVQLEVHPESHNMDQTTQRGLSPPTASIQSLFRGRAEPAGFLPTRCLSPSRQEQKCHPQGSEGVSQVLVGNSSVSLSRRLLQEVKVWDSTEPKEEEDNTVKSVDPSDHNLHLLSSLRIHGDDDEELRMLASLKREQEEDECRASGLSASQIHQCNVSISMSSDDTSTWTHISTPANQGHHYQKEMNPLLQSNPREWMDVLSPPIMPPGLQRRSVDTRNNRGNSSAGGDESLNEEENEEEYLNLLYDPCLNCYFDPKTGKYYELA
uniref:protein CFAP20DC n=1 Tax=Semicossyphus pulcher TaxID=241346 RepID=UPI0037E811FC